MRQKSELTDPHLTYCNLAMHYEEFGKSECRCAQAVPK